MSKRKYTVKKYPTGGEPDRYSIWGNLSDTVKKEGWLPSTWNKDYTEFSPNYGAEGKNVLIDGKNPSGNVVVRAGNNGLFDILIRDSGKQHPDFYVKKGLNASDAHNYFVNDESLIKQRSDAIVKMPYGGGPLTAEGAKEILRDGKVHGKKLTEKQKRYFGYIAGGGKPKAQDGYDIAPIHNQPPSIYDPVPQDDVNNLLKKDSPSYGVKQPMGYPITIQDFMNTINGAAIGVTALAQSVNSNRDFRNEQRKYYEELNQPVEGNNFVENNLPAYMRTGGKWIPHNLKKGRCDNPGDEECPKGSPQYNLAMTFKKHHGFHKEEYGGQVEAEKGEVFTDTSGDIMKISDNAPSHEQGGVPLTDVNRVLENTSTRRDDKTSRDLKIGKKEFQAMFGFESNRPVSHAKALELADAYFAKDRGKYNKEINRGLDRLNENRDDVYANNSVRLNIQNTSTVPSKEDLFDFLFNHQEMSKGMTEQQPQAKYGYDPNDPYESSKTKAGRTTPTGRSNLFDYGSLADVNRKWKQIAGINGANMSNEEFQSRIYDWYLENDPGGLKRMWQSYGNTAKGKAEGIQANFKNPSSDDLKKLKDAYVDGKLGARTLVPPTDTPGIVKTSKPTELTPPTIGNGTPSYGVVPPTGQQSPDNPGISLRPPQKSSKFNEPLNWYDLAGPLMTLTSAERIPAKYNPVKFNEVRLKLQNPEPSLAAGQRQYNQAASLLPDGAPNVADLFSAKYNADNQVLGNYENVNSQIKNQETMYNAQVKDKQSVADAQSRQTFEQQMLGSKEAERQQKLSAFDDLFTRIALNRKLNREGNLLMQLFPNYDQYGEYNGNQRYFTSGTTGGAAANQNGVQFSLETDPVTGQQFRVATDRNGKLISKTKFISNSSSINGTGR